MIVSSSIESQWLGLLDYDRALNIQQSLRQSVAQNSKRVYLMGLEHPSVITLGRRAKPELDIYGGHSIPIVQTDRGGQATLHSPGQLVIYPILSVQDLGLGPRTLVRLILNTTAEILNRRLIATTEVQGAGLASSQGKLTFVGLRLSQGISTHGLAINVSNDLSLFRGIRPCGQTEPRLASLKSHGLTEVTLEGLFNEWQNLFTERLKLLAGSGGVC